MVFLASQIHSFRCRFSGDCLKDFPKPSIDNGVSVGEVGVNANELVKLRKEDEPSYEEVLKGIVLREN